MENSNNGSQAQGAPTHNQVKEWIVRDLKTAISFLNAIHSDPDLLEAVATFMLGRLTNQKHKEELAKQTKLEV